MKSQFLHNINNSFRLWFEHELLQEGQAFRNVSGSLYSVETKFNNKYSYSNPYGQFVYDSSVSGANIITGAYVNGVYNSRGTNGLSIDYNNGNVLFNSAQNNVTANYSVKEYSIYSTTRPDAALLMEEKQRFNPKFIVDPVKGIPEDTNIGPLIYLRRDSYTNEPFALGGMDNSTTIYRAIIFAPDDFSLDGVASIFGDSARKNLMLLTNNSFNRYGDVINGPSYNYLNDVNNNFHNENLVSITDVDYYRFDANTEVSLDKDSSMGVLEFILELPRYPRLS